MRFIVIILLFSIIHVSSVCAQIIEVGSIASDFSLKDQNDKLIELSKLRNKIVVITASGREGADDNKVWGEALGKEYGNKLIYLGAADLRGVPLLFRWFALQIAQKATPPEISMLLDWEGEIFKSYDLVTGVSNVIVIDNNGIIRAKEAGKCNKEGLQRIIKAIDKILESRANCF